MIFRLGASILFFASATGQAYADWQFTSWGMTPDELARTENITKLPEKSGESTETSVALFSMPYIASGIETTAIFHFSLPPDSNGLTEVRLKVNSVKDCPGVVGLLGATYKSENSESRSNFSIIRVWETDDSGNRILYVQTGTDSDVWSCQVVYQPFIEGNLPGSF